MSDQSLAQQDQLDGLLSPWLRKLRIQASLKWLQPGAVLDIGCGVAKYADAIPPHYTYTGFEINPSIYQMAKTRRPTLPLFNIDIMANDPQLEDHLQSYDNVVLLAVLEHVPDPAAFLTRAGQFLKPGAHLIATTPSPIGEPVMAVTEKLGLSSKESHDEHEDLLGREELERIVAASGLRLVHYKRFLLGLNQLIVASL
jgi:2-polyprenyl-3-methyl-5-hydroxy-6-metoxy-1,4-benzoquinol methylase